jgi:hypothetical protein
MPRAKAAPPDKQKFGDRVLARKWKEAGKNCNEAARRLLKEDATDNEINAFAKEVSRAVDRMKKGTSVEHVNAVKNSSRLGRLPALDIEGIKRLKALAWRTAQQRSFIRPTETECKEHIKTERAHMMVRRGMASRFDLVDMNLYPIAPSVEMSYLKSIWPEDEKARHVSSHREQVKREIRNNISCCAVAGYVFDHTNPDCIETSNHFAVYRDTAGDYQVVRSAAGSGQMMRDSGFSVGFDGQAEKKKRRGKKDKTGGDGSASSDANVKLPAHASFTMSKKVVALIAEIWDDQVVQPFEDGSVVKIFPIDATDPADPLTAECYAAHIVHGTPHEVVMHTMYKDIIIPKMVKIREQAKAMAETLRGQAVFGGAVGSVSVGEKRARNGTSAMAAATSVAAPSREVQNLSTSTIQPNTADLRSSSTSRRAAAPIKVEEADDDEEEVTYAHGPWVGMSEEFEMVLCLDGDSASITAILYFDKMSKHCDRKHPNGRKSLADIIVPLAQCSPCMQAEHARLFATAIKPARKSAFWRLLSNLPNAAAEAFRPKALAASWTRAGFLPLSFINILSKCSLWAGDETFSADQKRDLIDLVPRLYSSVAACGRAPDLKMEELWPFLPKVEGCVHTLEDLAINRDRVALITHPHYFDGRVEAAAAAHDTNPQLKKKAKTAAPRPAQTYRPYPLNDEQLVKNFPAWQVLAQLEMRGVPVGRTTAVSNLRELWKTNSNLPCLPAFAPHLSVAELQALQDAQPPTPTRSRPPVQIARAAGGGAYVPPSWLNI